MITHDDKYLTLVLGAEEYGVPVRDVREIVGTLPITPVPGTPHHVLGIVNLRGKVIPVIDLRLRLGLPATTVGPRACVVVCHGRDNALVGMLVDSVVEVLPIKHGDTEPPPTLAGAEVSGLAKSKGRVVIILDISTTISVETMAA